MVIERKRARLLAGAAGLMLLPIAATAQPTPVTPVSAQDTETVTITGNIFRDRSTAIAPTLEYGLDYFQPFEPLTVGDILKRTPSTAFVSDILEFDGVRLRGLDPGYTQILINGKRVPGADVDRSFWVDRIPAELVERVEIVRSSSANRSGDAVAGALNIVLRDALEFTGAYARAGALYFDDGEIKPVIGGVVAGAIGAARGILGLNLQGRHNPKQKQSFRYGPEDGVLELDNREDQSDVRDGTDYSANGDLVIPVGMGNLRLSGYVVHTDRTETEISEEYEDLTSLDLADLVTAADQFEDITQDNYTLSAALTQTILNGETEFSVDFTKFNEDIIATENESEFDPFPTLDDFGGTRTFSKTDDRMWMARFDHRRTLGGVVDLEFGVDFSDKEREGHITEAEIDTPGDPFPEPETIEAGFFKLNETRVDPFIMFSRTNGVLAWEAGLRYETTDTKVIDLDSGDEGSTSYEFLLPSAHAKINLSEDDRISLSAARTVRRPNFDWLTPATIEESPTEDDDFRGNPNLKPEDAWGFDVGYERRLGRMGVTGINFFYRDVSNLIEFANTGEISDSGDGFVFTPENVGDGQVWGIEFDFSAPLTVLGMPNTGLFVNYSWLDSSVTDPVTGVDRRFNNQAHSVFNIGFIQQFPTWGMAFGASYRKQGEAFASVAGETVKTTYGGDLEAFIEKRFGERFVVRLTGSNLLNASKDETFHKWETVDDQLSGDIDALDEFELESEKAGPVFQLVGRYQF
jgi:outer membrane receptor protein involved in Fe transport